MFSNNYAIKQQLHTSKKIAIGHLTPKQRKSSCKNLNSAHFQDLLSEIVIYPLIRLVKIEILISGTFQEIALRVKFSVFSKTYLCFYLQSLISRQE